MLMHDRIKVKSYVASLPTDISLTSIEVNSLTSGRFECHFRQVNFEQI